MRSHRIAVVVLVAALVALPVAYFQLNAVMEGTGLLAATFGASDPRALALN